MTLVAITCAHCGGLAQKEAGAVNRAASKGAPMYCGKSCSGLARRMHRTDDEKRALKSEYDRKRRDEIGDVIRAKKRAAYHAAVAENPEFMREREREWRKKRMPKHVEYCRRPEYREWKQKYDREFRAKKHYGEFWETSLLLVDIKSEVSARASRYTMDLAAGRLCKAKRRKREYDKAVGC